VGIRVRLAPLDETNLKHSTFDIHIENIRIFSCLNRRQSDERSCDINRLRCSSQGLFTGFAQKMWKTALVRTVLFLSVAVCLAVLPSCSLFKGGQKAPKTVSGPDTALISQDGDRVKARFGEPTVISKTNEGHVLWVYRPTWKIIPNDSGTLYVEFEEGKVIKIFKK
jgi:hypothetical protein